MAERLDGCQVVTVLPDGFNEAPPSLGIQWSRFSTISSKLATFADMQSAEATFEGFVQGHPGYPGGVPQRPTGFGIEFGKVDANGTEWWLSEAEGLTTSPEWEQVTAIPGLSDGVWLLDVKARNRQIMLRGALLGKDISSTTRSASEASSVLSNRPRTGWLRWEAADGTIRRLPIAMAAPVKLLARSERWMEVEVSVAGINIGTPGQGVFFEAESWVPLKPQNGTSTFYNVEGTVPSPPVITFTGPVSAGAIVQLGGYSILLDDDVPAGSRLQVVSGNYRVKLIAADNSETQGRDMVSFGENRWPIMAVGAVPVLADWDGSGFITVEVMGLW